MFERDSYIKNNLLKNEEILFLAKIHPIIFLLSLNIILVAVFINYTFIYILMSTLLVLVLCASAIYYFSTEFGVTNKRIIKKTGLLSRDTVELNLEKIESLSVDQSIFGRIFNYGTLTVVGTGGTRAVVNWVEDPLEFRKVYIEHIMKN
jgi:uncharacterized membrane protein YdbT with pleckstrin-like domain